MAILHGRTIGIGPRTVELSPVLPSDSDGPGPEAYTFSVRDERSGLAWSRTYSVRGWFMGQDDIWYVARVFARADALVCSTIPAEVWPTIPRVRSAMRAHVDWLYCSLVQPSKRPIINCVLFALEGDDPAVFRRYFVQATVDACVAFGIELEREIIAASPTWAADRQLDRGRSAGD